VQIILDRHHAKHVVEEPMVTLSDVQVNGLQKRQDAVIPHLLQLLGNKQGKASGYESQPEAEDLIDNVHQINPNVLVQMRSGVRIRSK
jgi:hypothetical protein